MRAFDPDLLNRYIDLTISFAELFGGNQAADRVRGQNVPKTGPTLDYLGTSSHLIQMWLTSDMGFPAEEAFTSENWIVSSNDTSGMTP